MLAARTFRFTLVSIWTTAAIALLPAAKAWPQSSTNMRILGPSSAQAGQTITMTVGTWVTQSGPQVTSPCLLTFTTQDQQTPALTEVQSFPPLQWRIVLPPLLPPGTYTVACSSKGASSNSITMTISAPSPSTGSSPVTSAVPSYSPDLCPGVSMFVSSPELAAELYNQDISNNAPPLDGQATNAAFFANPPLNWNQAVVPGCPQNLSIPLQGAIGLTVGGQSTPLLSIQGAIPVTTTQVNLEIPLYFDTTMGQTGPTGEGNLTAWTPDFFNYAHFEVEVDALTSDSGGNLNWQTLTQSAVDIVGNNWPAGEPLPSTASSDTVVTESQGPPYTDQLTIPVTLTQPTTTLRVGVWIKVMSSENEVVGQPWCCANGPSGWEIGQTAQLGTAPQPSGAGVQAGAASAETHTWLFSPAFQLYLLPSSLAGAPVIPYAIAYMPPGNQSTESVQNVSGTAQAVTYSLTNQQSTQDANTNAAQFTYDPSGAVKFAGIPLGKMGIGVGTGTTSSTMDNSSSSTSQTQVLTATTSLQSGVGTSAKTELCFGAGGSVSSSTACQPAGSDNITFWEEPFWNDTMIVLIQPIAGVWNYQGFEAAQIVGYTPPSQNWTDVISMYQLFEGAYGNYFNYPLLDGFGLCVGSSGWEPAPFCNTVYLTPQVCAGLFSLDPFAAALWQGATPDPGRATRIGQINTGTVSGARTFPIGYSSIKAIASGNGGGQGNSTCNASGNSNQLIGHWIPFLSGSLTNTNTVTNCTNVNYVQSVLDTNSQGITVSGSVSDTGSLVGQQIQVYLDTWFGGIMFQDPNEPGTQTVNDYRTEWQEGKVLRPPEAIWTVLGQTGGSQGSHCPVTNETPAVASVAPNEGPARGNFAVMVRGTGFCGASSITVGGAKAESFTILSDSEARAVLPALPTTATIPASGYSVDVAVCKPSGCSPQYVPGNFRYMPK